MIDEALFEYATARQREILEKVNELGSGRAAERFFGLASGTTTHTLQSVKAKAAAQGYSPDHDMTRRVPDGYRVKGVSTYYGKDGDVRGQWVKSQVDHLQAEAMARTLVEAMVEAVAPGPVIAPPETADEDLLCLYPMGDPHFGMHAYAAEVGESFDLKIAERLNRRAVDYLVATAPSAHKAILANMGDFFHADNDSAMTPGSGNRLDVDTRHHKVLTVGTWTMIYLVQRLLEKHHEVEVLNIRGNHDPISSMVLSIAMSMYFKDNSRVSIEGSPAYFHYREFGKNQLGFTHGDGPKEADLPGIMAHDAPEAWGRSKYRVVHRGHFHHDRVQDYPGVTVETHRTLAASDAWHRKSGYRSPRDMKVITFHREHGELSRSKVNVDRLLTE